MIGIRVCKHLFLELSYIKSNRIIEGFPYNKAAR